MSISYFTASGGALLAWLLCFPIRAALLKCEVVDRPTERSSHAAATPRGGGLAIIVSVILVVVFARVPVFANPELSLLISTIFLAAISFADDVRSLPSQIRFICHSAAAILLVAAIIRLSPHLFENYSFWRLATVIFGVLLWVIGYANAFNFMDGINGLAASQAVLTATGLAIIGAQGSGVWGSPPELIALAVAGSAFGFLPHNAVNPRLFMGDVGSIPLGFLLAALTLWLAVVAGGWLLLPMLMLHANFVLDTSITMFRRILRGDQWLKPHREHFYQKLVQTGVSHIQVTLIEMGLQLVALGLMLIYLAVGQNLRWALLGMVVSMWLAFFALIERRFRQSRLIRTRLATGTEQ